jgi:galacturan 1,4-alpha-galacturonidase
MALSSNTLRVFFLVAMLVCAAGKAAPKKGKSEKSEKAEAPAEGPSAEASGPGGSFDISKLGASSDGKKDSTKAVMEAWTSACDKEGKQTILIPKGDFLVGPLNLSGPCKGPITIKLEGNLLGSTNLDEYKANWIEIIKVDDLVITGDGKLDGQGPKVWENNKCDKKYDCKILPNVSDNKRRYILQDVLIRTY